MCSARVFVSHSSKDAAAARELVAELEARAVPCWLDKRDIAPGRDYDEEIIAAIVDCRALVVLVSSSSIASKHVRSEVARASSEGKPIYPVRLIDVEVAGGLQFHLELSQWVDFFPNPTAESYDRLAEAIRTGVIARQVIRKRADPRRWAIFTVLSIAGLILTTVFGLVAYAWWQERQIEEAIAQSEAETAQQEALNNAKALQEFDLNPQFDIMDGKVRLQSVLWVGFPQGAGDIKIGLSLNNGPIRLLPDTFWGFELGVAPKEVRSLVFSVLSEDGTVLKTLDKTAALQAIFQPLTQNIRERLAAPSGLDLYCSIAGCEIATDLLCNSAVTSVTMQADGKAVALAPERCAENSGAYKACLPAQDFPFHLVPGEQQKLNFTLIDGSNVAINLPVGGLLTQSEDMAFVELPPAPGSEGAPALFLSYTPPGIVVGQLNFVLGWGSCDQGLSRNSVSGSSSIVFADVDGRGLVPNSGANSGNPNLFPISFSPGDTRELNGPINTSLIAKQTTVRFALGTRAAMEHGPWTYTFDLANVLQASLPPGRMPEVRCTQDGNSVLQISGDQGHYCYAVNPEMFLGVSAVEFAKSPGQPSVRLPVDYSATEYVSGLCEPEGTPCPFMFEIPKDWADVYSSVVMASGERMVETRHNSPQP